MKKFFLSLVFLYWIMAIHPNITNAQIYPINFDVIIDVGHGGIDGGTSFQDILEKDITLNMAKKLSEQLQKRSFLVGMTRTRDYALSDDSSFPQIRSRHMRDLKQRKLIADSLEPKLFISLHVNWSKNRRYRGPLVIYQTNERGYALAQLIQQHLNAFYGTNKSAIKGKPYFLMKHLDMPAVIVELGYLSHPSDRNILVQEHTQDQLVAAITHAIEEYFIIYPT
jgi:N-acetylmuramoyl-L-alanine amidase